MKGSDLLCTPVQLNSCCIWTREIERTLHVKSESSPQCPYSGGYPASSGYFKGCSSHYPWGLLSCIWKKSNIPNFSVQRGGKVRKLKEGWGPSKTGNRKIFPRYQCPCLIVLVGKLPLVIRCSSWLFGPNSPPTHSVSREHSALLFWG